MDPNVPEYQKQFINSLEAFLEQCYVFIETQQEQNIPPSK